MRGLHEELVVPAAHSSREELARGNDDGGIPEEIVERGRDAPGAERVKESAARLAGLVRMALVERLPRMLRVEKARARRSSSTCGSSRTRIPARKPSRSEAGELLGREPAARRVGRESTFEDRSVVMRQIGYHGHFIMA
jgi:hypothetical protein